jgi:hypothetical protein
MLEVDKITFIHPNWVHSSKNEAIPSQNGNLSLKFPFVSLLSNKSPKKNAVPDPSRPCSAGVRCNITLQ